MLELITSKAFDDKKESAGVAFNALLSEKSKEKYETVFEEFVKACSRW